MNELSTLWKTLQNIRSAASGVLRIGNRLSSQDRDYLEQRVFEALNAKLEPGRSILFVGIDHYTSHYSSHFKRNHFFTIDVRPKQAIYGTPGRHKIGSILKLREVYADKKFAAVVINGVFGYGVNDPDSIALAMQQISATVEPDGWVIVGWNPARTTASSFPTVSDIGLTAEALVPGDGTVVDFGTWGGQLHQFLSFRKSTTH